MKQTGGGGVTDPRQINGELVDISVQLGGGGGWGDDRISKNTWQHVAIKNHGDNNNVVLMLGRVSVVSSDLQIASNSPFEFINYR